MAHNFLHNGPSQAGSGISGDPKALIDRFLDAIWMERGLSDNTLGAYRADLIALNQRLGSRNVELARAGRADILDYIAWRVESGAKPRSTARQLSRVDQQTNCEQASATWVQCHGSDRGRR
jgi:site-specific recombinase XerC